MIKLGVFSSQANPIAIEVPAGADGIIGFSTAVDNGAVQKQIAISSDLSYNPIGSADGIDNSLLCISNTIFPKIPVVPGERLLVAFTAVGSAVIYFDSAENAAGG